MINVYLCTTPWHLSTRETFSSASLFFVFPPLAKRSHTKMEAQNWELHQKQRYVHPESNFSPP